MNRRSFLKLSAAATVGLYAAPLYIQEAPVETLVRTGKVVYRGMSWMLSDRRDIMPGVVQLYCVASHKGTVFHGAMLYESDIKENKKLLLSHMDILAERFKKKHG